MGELALSNRVIARDSFGQFIAACQIAGEHMMEDMAKEGAELSRSFAPVGTKYDPRTVHLKDSISHSFTATSAQWSSTARHALAQEKGAVPHEITGDVTFFWNKEGRMWHPGANIIQHPGNRSQPFLRPAYEIVMSNWMRYAVKYYPQ